MPVDPVVLADRRRRRGERLAAVAELAASQGGLVTRDQLSRVGVDRAVVARRVAAGRWSAPTGTVVSTTSGPLALSGRRWLGILTAPGASALAGRTALEMQGLQRWEASTVTAMVAAPQHPERLPEHDVEFVRSRRPFATWCVERDGLPVLRAAVAAVLLAERLPTERAAGGLLAACVQQRITTAETLAAWVDRLRPLRRAEQMRVVLADIGGGAHSMAEVDLVRLCRDNGLAEPVRQVQRRDRDGRVRWTDAEWRLPSGRTVVLEVDGAFHRDVESWVDDLARQRALTTPDRVVLRCASTELRETPDLVAGDLVAVGVPVVAPALRKTAR